MGNFTVIFTQTKGDEDSTTMIVNNVTPTPDGKEFKSGDIVYADLSEQEKHLYQSFIGLVKSKCK